MRDNNFQDQAHPSDGAWRAYLDGEVSPLRRLQLRRHVGACSDCRARLDDVGAAGDRTSLLLSDLSPRMDVQDSWERLYAVTRWAAGRRRSRASAFVAGGLSAAALAAAVLLVHPAPTRLLGRLHGVGTFSDVLDDCCFTNDAATREGVFTLQLTGAETPLQVHYLDADGSGTFSPGDVVRSVSQVRRR